MKITTTIKTILALSIAMLMANCETEKFAADEYGNQDKIMSTSKSWFEDYEANGENYDLVQNLQYDWDVAEITKSEDGTETVIVPINELKKDQRDFWEQRLYIYKTGEQDYKALVYEIYTNKNVEPESQSIDGGDFTGFISVWDLKAGFVRAARFENNRVVETGDIEVIDYTKRSATNKAPIEAPCVYADFGDGGCGGMSGGDTATPLRPVIVTAPSKGAPVVYYGPRSPVIGGTGTGGYTSPGGGGGNSGGGGITAPTPEKITDELIGKARCINALLNKNGNSFVQKLLANFTGTSKFDIRLESVEKITTIKNGVTREDNGKTSYIKGATEIKIQISSSRMESIAALEGVRVLLHEYIHADMFRKINSNNDNSAEALEFKKVFEEYENDQHSTMGILYVNSMKAALKEFYETVLKDDYNKYVAYYGEVPSDAFYEAVAWGGLKDSDVKAWTDLPDDKKASINSLANRVIVLGKTVPCPN